MVSARYLLYVISGYQKKDSLIKQTTCHYDVCCDVFVIVVTLSMQGPKHAPIRNEDAIIRDILENSEANEY